MSRSLTTANKASLYNAFELAAKKKLGKPFTEEDILSVAKRTTVLPVAARILTEISATTEKQTFMTTARVALALADIYCKQSGITTQTVGTQMPIILGAFFLNRLLNDASSTIAQVIPIKLPIERKFITLFESFWSSLDVDSLKEKMSSVKSESSTRVTFKTIKSTNVYDGTDKVSYMVSAAGRPCGKIAWDKACGECSDRSTGWLVTLFDGFNEAAYRSGRGPNANEPFTAVHGGEVKLQNPSRMTLAMAKTWAREALRG